MNSTFLRHSWFCAIVYTHTYIYIYIIFFNHAQIDWSNWWKVPTSTMLRRWLPPVSLSRTVGINIGSAWIGTQEESCRKERLPPKTSNWKGWPWSAKKGEISEDYLFECLWLCAIDICQFCDGKVCFLFNMFWWKIKGAFRGCLS